MVKRALYMLLPIVAICTATANAGNCPSPCDWKYVSGYKYCSCPTTGTIESVEQIILTAIKGPDKPMATFELEVWGGDPPEGEEILDCIKDKPADSQCTSNGTSFCVNPADHFNIKGNAFSRQLVLDSASTTTQCGKKGLCEGHNTLGLSDLDSCVKPFRNLTNVVETFTARFGLSVYTNEELIVKTYRAHCAVSLAGYTPGEKRFYACDFWVCDENSDGSAENCTPCTPGLECIKGDN
jgi:hypothetical protein